MQMVSLPIKYRFNLIQIWINLIGTVNNDLETKKKQRDTALRILNLIVNKT